LNKIKYINLYNAKNYDASSIFIFGNFILNQKEHFETPFTAIPTYCDTNKSPLKCESNNYIIVKYKETVNYTSGFIIENCESRNGISYIINKDSIIGAFANNEIGGDFPFNPDIRRNQEIVVNIGMTKTTDPFIIEANSTIEIHFTEPINTLENFFNCDLDKNSQSINYVDLSHFDSSFVEDTDGMFNGCDNLEYLDISNFNINVNSLSLNFDKIKYISLNNLTNQNLITYLQNSNLKNKNNLLVCQNSQIIPNQKAIENCIDFNENPLKSDSDNYITVQFNEYTTYDSGFKIESCTSRNDIRYISQIFQQLSFLNKDTPVQKFFN